MASDESGNPGPDGIGMYSDKYTALEVGRNRAAMQAQAYAAAYEQARNEPTPLSRLVMLGTLGVAIVGSSVATAAGISFDNAIWLMLGMLTFAAIIARIVVKRAEARRTALELEAEAQSLGFSTPAAYERAVLERRTRLSAELYDELVQEMLAINERTTGRSDVETLSEFEKALEWTAQQRGLDAVLRGQDFEVPRPTLRRALSSRLKDARAGLLLKPRSLSWCSRSVRPRCSQLLV